MNQVFRVIFLLPILFSCVFSFKVRKIPLQTLDLESVIDNVKIWQHDGFDHMSALQINEKLNLRVSVTSKLLMAHGDGPAHLQTTLKNYEHTFLTIKFSTIIGKVKSDGVGPKTERTSSEILNRPGEGKQNSTENIHGHNEKDMPPLLTLVQTPGPKDTKEDDHPVLLHISSLEAKELEKAKKSTLEKRKKRNIDISSQELLQIHKIIKMAKQTADDSLGNKTLDKNGSFSSRVDIKSIEFTERSVTTTTTPKEVSSNVKDKMKDDLNNSSFDSKLNYKTWRASFDKNYRPPGFYLLVDDQVIYDNWFGVWDRPNVLGKVTLFSSKRTWNETEIQFQWDEPPKRDLKLSFEWDPMEKDSYMLIDNIEIFTFGVQQEIPVVNSNGNVNGYANGNMQSNNNNLTVYIVVKPAPVSQSHEASFVVSSVTSRIDAKGDITGEKHSEGKTIGLEHTTESHKDKKLADDLIELIKTVQQNVTKENEEKLIAKNKNLTITTTPQPDSSTSTRKAKDKPSKSFKDDKTGLIVLIVFIVMATLILITLLHRKIKEDRNPNRSTTRCCQQSQH